MVAAAIFTFAMLVEAASISTASVEATAEDQCLGGWNAGRWCDESDDEPVSSLQVQQTLRHRRSKIAPEAEVTGARSEVSPSAPTKSSPSITVTQPSAPPEPSTNGTVTQSSAFTEPSPGGPVIQPLQQKRAINQTGIDAIIQTSAGWAYSHGEVLRVLRMCAICLATAILLGFFGLMVFDLHALVKCGDKPRWWRLFSKPPKRKAFTEAAFTPYTMAPHASPFWRTRMEQMSGKRDSKDIARHALSAGLFPAAG